MFHGRVIVIGGGAAGVWAALAARRSGASVALVRQSAGASAVSSGALDLGAGRDVSGRPVRPEDAAAGLARSQADHPYRAIGASLSDAVGRARDLLISAHKRLGLTGANGRNLSLVTPLGSVKESWLAQGSIARGDLQNWPAEARLGVVAIPNSAAFDGHAVANSLKASGRNAVALPIDIGVHPFASLVELAKWLDQPESGGKFVQAVATAAKSAGATHILVPTAGLADPNGLLDGLAAAGLTAAAELISTPPSVPGLRLERDLLACLEDAGIELISGSVREAVKSGGRVERLQLEDGRELEATAFVLATGRFLGGGIRHEGIFHETVFGLPVFVDGQDVADQWLGDLLNRNAAATQSALKAGVAVDGSLRPVNAQLQVVFENLFTAGSVIGGYDPAKDTSGLGVAAITALVAGEGAARFAQDQNRTSAVASRRSLSTAAEELRP